MRIDVLSKPPALPFGSGDEAFSVTPRRMTEVDRGAFLDAFAAEEARFATLSALAAGMIESWSGLQHPDGSELRPYATFPDGSKISGAHVMAALPLRWQIEIIVAMAAFCGLPEEGLAEMRRGLAAWGARESRGDAPDPTPSSGDATGATGCAS